MRRIRITTKVMRIGGETGWVCRNESASVLPRPAITPARTAAWRRLRARQADARRAEKLIVEILKERRSAVRARKVKILERIGRQSAEMDGYIRGRIAAHNPGE